VPGAIPWSVPHAYVAPSSDDLIGIFALSTALGLDTLPVEDQLAITHEWQAWATRQLSLDGWWAHVPTVDLTAITEAVDEQLDAGAVGIVLSAPRLARSCREMASPSSLRMCVETQPAARPRGSRKRVAKPWPSISM
jgi:hypothetical protein